MPPRRYTQQKRAEAAAETRQRIVEACYALHGRQGISGTSMSEIAREAGVSVGTVYFHFPAYEDAVEACGRHSAALHPMPGPEVLDGVEGAPARFAAVAAAIFAFYEDVGSYALILRDRERFAPVAHFAEAEEVNRRDLVRRALGGRDGRRHRLAFALLDVGVHDALRAQGFSSAEAAREVAALVGGAAPSPRHQPPASKDHRP